MKINSFFEKDSTNNSKKLQITASGVQNIVNNASVERLETEIENLKSKLDIAETNLKNTTETHLKEKEQFSIAIRKSKEANTEVSKVRERYALLALDNQALKEIGFNKNVKNLVLHQAKLANKAKLDAIVCSAQEVKIVKKVTKKHQILMKNCFENR